MVNVVHLALVVLEVDEVLTTSTNVFAGKRGLLKRRCPMQACGSASRDRHREIVTLGVEEQVLEVLECNGGSPDAADIDLHNCLFRALDLVDEQRVPKERTDDDVVNEDGVERISFAERAVRDRLFRDLLVALNDDLPVSMSTMSQAQTFPINSPSRNGNDGELDLLLHTVDHHGLGREHVCLRHLADECS